MLLRLRSTCGRSGTIGAHRWPPEGRMRLGAERETSVNVVGKLSSCSASECMCVSVCVWGLGCSPLAPLAEFLGSLKHSVLVFAQRAEFHLNSTRCLENQINLHWKPSTGVDYVERGWDRVREEGTPSTRADTRWPQPGVKLAPMIDSLNENLMENSFASHKLV